MAWNESPSSPRAKPRSWPVSCRGTLPLGTMLNSQMFRPTTLRNTSTGIQGRRNTRSSEWT
jgi:hypothetical protein